MNATQVSIIVFCSVFGAFNLAWICTKVIGMSRAIERIAARMEELGPSLSQAEIKELGWQKAGISGADNRSLYQDANKPK